jgi:hypothetical protein
MPTVARFDENGLWHWDDIFFSRYGNLKNTVIHLINNSSSGLSGKEIGDLVRLPARSFLHHFRNLTDIQREKRQGVYIYFSQDPDRYKQQFQGRLSRLEPPGKFVTDADAVIILTALIKHHDIGIEDILALPEVQARGFSPDAVAGFMNRYGLLKKTPITKP